MKVRVPGVRKLRNMIERGNPLWAATQEQVAPGHHHKQFVESSYSARYSGWDDDKAWSSQEWKADELMDDCLLLGKTHEFQSRFSHEKTQARWKKKKLMIERGPRQRGARPQQFIIGDDEAELELSLGSRSFLDRVNDQVRKDKNDLR